MVNRNKFVLVVLSTIFVFYAVVGGLLGRATEREGSYSQLSVFNEVLSKIRNSYVEDPNLAEVMNGALRGLLESLDSYSTYLSPDEYSRYKKHKTNGNGGLGLELSKERMLGYAYIIHPIESGPADKVGVKPGDVIESIEEVSTRDISLLQAEYLMTGKPGSTVKLKILRRGKVDPLNLAVTRDFVKAPPVKASLLEKRIAYLKIYRFTPGISDDVRLKLQQLTKNGASRVILDLRDCAGEEFEEGVKVANFFLDHGVIAYTQGQKSPKKEFVADPAKALTKLPLVVLQNYGSASAAEIVSAAIKENRRGEVVGVKSFGKASLQQLIPLESDSAVLLSTAKFYSQSGKVIQGNGITPDVEVLDGREGLSADGDGDEEDSEDTTTPPKPTSHEDLQLKKAIELLSAPASEKKAA
ncbi:MAG: S41 family peptidase [Acidobacteria bacterium]|nr:S41 family peptidase [Acidobacteriota bacterium]